MEKIYGRTKTIQEDKVSGFCPGCMHSTVIKLIGEVLEEMDLVDRAACVLGIGCCGLHMDYIAYDNTTAPHGRACAVATGMKRSNPDSLVFTYQGDGDFASIGLARVYFRRQPGGEHHRHLHQQWHLRHDRRPDGPHHPGGHEGLHRPPRPRSQGARLSHAHV